MSWRLNTLRFCLPEVECIMILYLPRVISYFFFLAVYLSPQINAGTKTTLNELYTAVSKQEDTHPEAALQVAGDFNAEKIKYILSNFYQHVKCATRLKKKNH